MPAHQLYHGHATCITVQATRNRRAESKKCWNNSRRYALYLQYRKSCHCWRTNVAEKKRKTSQNKLPRHCFQQRTFRQKRHIVLNVQVASYNAVDREAIKNSFCEKILSNSEVTTYKVFAKLCDENVGINTFHGGVFHIWTILKNQAVQMMDDIIPHLRNKNGNAPRLHNPDTSVVYKRRSRTHEPSSSDGTQFGVLKVTLNSIFRFKTNSGLFLLK